MQGLEPVGQGRGMVEREQALRHHGESATSAFERGPVRRPHCVLRGFAVTVRLGWDASTTRCWSISVRVRWP